MNVCKEGKHDLIEIYSRGDRMSELVVRWCQNCGAIVIDKDFDGRTHPGRIMKMRLPKLTENIINKTDKNEI